MTDYTKGDKPITQGMLLGLRMSKSTTPQPTRGEVGGTSLSDQVRSVPAVEPDVTMDELLENATRGSKPFSQSEIRRGYRKL